jgi:hypothetical protein
MHETIAYVIIRLVSVVVDVAGTRLWRVTKYYTTIKLYS